MIRAVVVGRARGAVEEYRRACELCEFDLVLVVGALLATFPSRVDHAVSFHVELFDMWARQRADAGLPPAGQYWGARYRGRRVGQYKTRVWPTKFATCVGGSSGFLATWGVALGSLGVDRVVLAGVPMLAEFGHEGSDEPWREAPKYWAVWEERIPDMLGRVRSMSGRTRGALGAPDEEWLR